MREWVDERVSVRVRGLKRSGFCGALGASPS